MMASASHFKLGLLVLAGAAAAAAIVIGLGLRREPSTTYHAYFDESVQGLEVGALVKYRGVKIGRVGAIDIAPDHRHVAVELQIERDRATEVGLHALAPGVRAQLATLGITGLKIVDLDVFDPATSPRPVLAFTPEEPYIPSHPSLLTNLGRGLETTTDRVPELLDAAITTLDRLQRVLDGLQHERIPQRIAAVADATAQAADKVEHTLQTFDRAGRRLDDILTRIDGPDGLVASARRATESLGDVGRTTQTSTRELGETIRELGDAARSVRSFFDDLARQPDMLIKGRGGRR